MKSLNKYHIISLVILALVLIVNLLPFVKTTDLMSDVEDSSLTWAQLPNSTKVPGKDKSDWPSEIKFKEADSWANAQKAKDLYDDISKVSNDAKAAKIREVMAAVENDFYYNGVFYDALKSCAEAGEADPSVYSTKVKVVEAGDSGATGEAAQASFKMVDYLDANLSKAAADYFTFLDAYPLYGEKSINIFMYVWNPAGAIPTGKVNCYIFVMILFIAFACFTFFIKNYMSKAVVAFLFAITQFYAAIETLLLRADGSLPSYLYISILMIVVGLATVAAGLYFIPQFFRDKEANKQLKKSL